MRAGRAASRAVVEERDRVDSRKARGLLVCSSDTVTRLLRARFSRFSWLGALAEVEEEEKDREKKGGEGE
jgi:hypothetical protein